MLAAAATSHHFVPLTAAIIGSTADAKKMPIKLNFPNV